VKKTRRGGLGRGLGALIQSTADTEETTGAAAPVSASAGVSSASSSSASSSTSAGKTTSPRRRATSAAAAAGETQKDAEAETSSNSKGTNTSKAKGKADSTSTATGAKRTGTASAAKSTSATKSTATGKASEASDKTGAGKTGTSSSATSKKAPAKKAPAKASSSTSSNGTTRRSSRPVDVFFSSDRAADEQGQDSTKASEKTSEKATEASETSQAQDEATKTGRASSASKPSGRSGRPSMPSVSAPSRRRASQPAAEAEAAQKAAETGAEAREATDASASAPEGTVSTDIAVLRELRVTDIHPNPRQPREVFDEDHMDELVTSITEVGILQPVVVREVDGPTPYELIMGERRWRATQLAGLDTIPAIVRHTPDEDLLRDALLENLHRSQLNPLEEAAAYQQLMDDFKCTQEELSQRIGRSRPQISNTLRLMKLPPLVQRRVANNTLTAGHARALLGLTDPAEMERLAQRIVSEGLSVRATEEAVALAQGVRQAAPATRRRSEPTRHERLDYFATALTTRLDTQVKITLGKRKGKIAIDFASVEDLNRIMELIQGDGAQK
jgi:ParB family transcriptional regulator, chromosome partitioning protein